MMIDGLRPLCARGRLNGQSDKYAHAENRTQVVVICDPTRYQLDHGDAHIPVLNPDTGGQRVEVLPLTQMNNDKYPNTRRVPVQWQNDVLVIETIKTC